MVYVSCRFTPHGLTYKDQHAISLCLRRELIERFAGKDGWRLAVRYDGKPYVEGKEITYSVSHTDGCVLCAVSVPRNVSESSEMPELPEALTDEALYYTNAFTCHGEIGCDVERRLNRFNTEKMSKISQRYFTESERYKFENSGKKSETFYRIWTVKESLVKATGEGLKALRRTDHIDCRNVLAFDVINGEDCYSAAISVINCDY